MSGGVAWTTRALKVLCPVGHGLGQFEAHSLLGLTMVLMPEADTRVWNQ